ncbi:MAG: nitroreductase family protein [Candidatus Hydrogenedens sp.]
MMKPCKEIIYNYHEQTKHRPYRYARSLGYLDWNNEPNPFRRFQKTEQINLPILPLNSSPPFHEVLFQPQRITPQPIHIETISQFLLFSMGISAWKEYSGSRWAVRCNPSSGNLHPTETYLIFPPQLLDNNSALLLHYDPAGHQLEKRAIMAQSNWEKQGLPSFTEYPCFFVALTSIIWREAWKYGERALRYCLLDAGHAIASLTFSALSLGWNIQYIGTSLQNLSLSLGLKRSEYAHVEKEFPQILLMVTPNNIKQESQLSFGKEYYFLFDKWFGIPEKISHQTIDWDIIDKTVSAIIESSKNFYSSNFCTFVSSDNQEKNLPYMLGSTSSPPSFKLFRQRRSAHAFDVNAVLNQDDFFQILIVINYISHHLLKKVIPLAPRISLLFFIHHVENLTQGIYVYPLNQKHFDKTIPSFFNKIYRIETKGNLPLFLCKKGNMRQQAEYLCCGQEIARDGVLCTGIFTHLEEELQYDNGFSYATLHWEAGFLGLLIYLESEIFNLRGTGIGCFFDDEIIKIMEVSQQHKILIDLLYYFAMGKPIYDERIKTYPPYPEKEMSI